MAPRARVSKHFRQADEYHAPFIGVIAAWFIVGLVVLLSIVLALHLRARGTPRPRAWLEPVHLNTANQQSAGKALPDRGQGAGIEIK